MNKLKAIIILALVGLIDGQASTGTICPLQQNGTATCNIACSNCNNGICLACCTNYYRQSNSCIQCYDINCISCSSSSCNRCESGYAPLTLNANQCWHCNNQTSINCQAANNCSSNLNCVNCLTYALNEGN